VNPNYEPRRQTPWDQLKAVHRDLEMLRFKLMYGEMGRELLETFAMLQLKRGCRR
jgi:hypothetical protein